MCKKEWKKYVLNPRHIEHIIQMLHIIRRYYMILYMYKIRLLAVKFFFTHLTFFIPFPKIVNSPPVCMPHIPKVLINRLPTHTPLWHVELRHMIIFIKHMNAWGIRLTLPEILLWSVFTEYSDCVHRNTKNITLTVTIFQGTHADIKNNSWFDKLLRFLVWHDFSWGLQHRDAPYQLIPTNLKGTMSKTINCCH